MEASTKHDLASHIPLQRPGGARVVPARLLAALGCSAFYAAVHFIAPDKRWEYPGWSLWVGFDYMAQILSRYTLPAVLLGMVGLLLIGLVLCWTIRRTRSSSCWAGSNARP